MADDTIIVISSLFPSAAAPQAGVFIRERMFRVARQRPLIVIAPQPWSPLDSLIRRWRPAFRPVGAAYERIDGIDIFRPRFPSLPTIGKRWDSRMMARSIDRCIAGLPVDVRPVLLDAHFLYPDGHAASLVASRRVLPLVVTVRGSKDKRLIGTSREAGMRSALAAAARVIVVSDALRDEVAIPLGASAQRIELIGNGVDLNRFFPEDRATARRRLGIPETARVLLTVGTLARIKGFHRIIALLPGLLRQHPDLHYLVVGGASGHDDMSGELRDQVDRLGLRERVHFAGAQPPDQLRTYYNAADLFILASAYEGWANVLLEAMACGIPVVATRVGGNAQVVPDESLGLLVCFWHAEAFAGAIDRALRRSWDRSRLLAHSRAHSWQVRIPSLVSTLDTVIAQHRRVDRTLGRTDLPAA